MKYSRPLLPKGFSLLELVLVAGVSAMIFSAMAIAFKAVSMNSKRSSTFQTVALSNAVSTSFFPGSAPSTVDSYVAPNFGRAAAADQGRNLFLDDCEKSIAVYPLARVGNINSIRQRIIPLGSYMAQALDTPAKFLECLLANAATATNAAVFTSYRGAPTESPVGSTTTFITNGTIFCLQPSGNATQMWTRAVWEIDYVPFTDSTNTTCLYATVRRYVNSTLTFYYDVVFRNSRIQDVGIPFAHFERTVRDAVSEGNSAFKVAKNQPYYMIWWPDPSADRIGTTATATTYASGPRTSYWRKEGQTNSLLIVPQYPAL